MTRAALSIFIACLSVTPSFAQDDTPSAGTAPADSDAADTPPSPAKCPVAGGTFSELNAVAVYLASQDKLGEAEACLTDAILTTMGAYRMLSDIATVNGQFGRAAGIAEMIDTLANTGDAKLFHAKKLLRINQNEKAKEILDALIEHNQENGEINHLMGVTQFRLQKNTEALASLEKAHALAPDNDVYTTELDTLKKVISGEIPNPTVEAAAAAATGGP